MASSPRDPSRRHTEQDPSAMDGGAEQVSGSVRAAIANALVAMKKTYYGRGPDAGRAWILDDYVFVVLEGGLTSSEVTLLEDGKEDVVRAYRLSFQETVTPIATRAVADLVGRPVVAYHSQIVFDPARTFEIFVLGDG
jgi:uncharacterized protein YbcI